MALATDLSNLRTATPVEIDTVLDQLWQSATHLRSVRERMASVLDVLASDLASGQPISSYEWRSYSGTCRTYQDAIAGLAWIAQAEAPLQAEFDSRPWRRYFLVLNDNGHVHRGMHCSTCFSTTRYAWIVALSGCDESAMVAEYGTKACTVCFPDAPTLPAWATAVEREQAAAKAEAEQFCPKSGTYASAGRNRYARCECGESVSVSRGGKFRQHQTPAQQRAEADAKRIAKNQASGRCVDSGLQIKPEREMRDLPYDTKVAHACSCGRKVTLSSNGRIPAHKEG